MSFDLYNQTPASNDQVNYFQTGMAPSKVKNAGWDIMADLAQFMSLPTSGGTANAQTITNTRACGAWFTGMWVCWVPNLTNTGSMTIQPDGLAAKNVFANGAAVLAGQVVSGIPAIGRYDGTQVQLVNPQRSTGSFTITLTGMTGTTTGTTNYAIGPDGKTTSVWFVNSILGTSNANTMTGTGVPAVLTASVNRLYTLRLEDNSVGVLGCISTVNSTTWTFGQSVPGGTGGFTSSGTKGVVAATALFIDIS